MEFNFDLDTEEKENFDYEKIYDVIIIGGGPGAFASAIYSKRKGLDVILVTKNLGGKVLDSGVIENYLGFESIMGEELVGQFEKHLKSYDIPFLEDVKVNNIKYNEIKGSELENGEVIKSRSVIISTGTHNKKLGIPGEDKFYGKGATYCAICDGPLYKKEDVCVIGGGNSAVEAAIDLSKYTNSVRLIEWTSELNADKILVDKLKSLDNIKIYTDSKVLRLEGDDNLEKVVIENRKNHDKSTFEVKAAFIEIGYKPNSFFVKDLLELNEKNEIIINCKNETSKKGIFAVGDVTNVPYKQILISASEGVKAALTVSDYLKR
ncbi:MAG: FAD-dependent oxidoreductase [Fusobacteriota bacterium]